MEDMEQRIGRGDLKQEKLDAIQVLLSFRLFATRARLTIYTAGHVRDSIGSSEEVDREEGRGDSGMTVVIDQTYYSAAAFAALHTLFGIQTSSAVARRMLWYARVRTCQRLKA